MKGKEAIVKLLEQAGVEVVFGLCGDTSLPYYEAFYDLKPGIKHVLTRDERSASYMADAYARLSGKVGVCEGPSGGGATYIIPGVVEANYSSVPVLCLTSDIDTRQRWRGTLTEIDQDALFDSFTVYTKTPENISDLPRAFRDAFQKMTAGKLGAAHIGLAMNVQTDDIADEEVFVDSRYTQYPAIRTAPDPELVNQAAKALLDSKKPVIVAGAGVIRSEAWDVLKELVDLIQCPVATSISGKGAIAETDPYALGVIGSNGGMAYRHDIVNEADLVFYIGCSCGSVTTEKWTLPVQGKATVIQMDVDASVIGKNYKVPYPIVADARLGLESLNRTLKALLGGESAAKWSKDYIPTREKEFMQTLENPTSDASPIRPERFITELQKAMPENGIIVADPGTPTPFLAAYYKTTVAGRKFVFNRAHGALGYSLSASVGAWYAKPDHKIVAIMGDGSFGFTCGEMETIRRVNAPVVLIVLRNSIYGWIKAGQKVMGEKYFSVDFSSTEHWKVAEAFGLKAKLVEKPESLEESLNWALSQNEPILLDIAVQPLHEANAPVSKWIA